MRNEEQITLFGKYRILELLGEGASGQVYLAEHLKLKICRAIKRISKAHPLQSQFRLEANLLKSLSHQSIPIIYDIEEDEGYIYIIEEYVEGESLQEYLLYHDSISQEYIMQLGIRLCEVFAYLHSRKPYPICYKDLKPEHIIVCGNSVKIVDFGIASYISDSGENFQEKLHADTEYIVPSKQYGTVGYAAPEQFRGESLAPATDLYALGKVMQQMEKHAKSSSKNLKRIIQKATAEEIGRRYESAVMLRDALKEEYKRVCLKETENTHLYSYIAVVGAKSGIGTTHLALAVTTYLNRQGFPCIYRSEDDTDTVELLVRGRSVSEEDGEIYARGHFRGMLKGNEACSEERKNPDDNCIVADYGNQLRQCMAAEADCTILVISGSLWEFECSQKAIEQMKHIPNLVIVCNYNHRRICGRYADMAGKRVYCFPFDEDPMADTKQKRRLLGKMLHIRHTIGRKILERW